MCRANTCCLGVALAVDAKAWLDFVVGWGDGLPVQRFLQPQAEETARQEASLEQPQHPFFQWLLEVDHDVPAQHHVHLAELAVPGQIVAGEHNPLFQGGRQQGMAVSGRVIVGKGVLRCFEWVAAG